MKLISSKRVSDSCSDNRKSKSGPADKNRKSVGIIAIVVVIAMCGAVALAQQPPKIPTGLSTLAPEISGKQLELLKEIVPKLSRVAFFGNSTEPGNAQATRPEVQTVDHHQSALTAINYPSYLFSSEIINS